MNKYDKILVTLTIWLIILATLVRLNLMAFTVFFFAGAIISLALFLPKKFFTKKQIKRASFKKRTI